MKQIKSVYINGRFAEPHGIETAEIISPLDDRAIAQLTYANEVDTQLAIQAATAALPAYSNTTIVERAVYLQRIHDEIMKRIDDLIDTTIRIRGTPRAGKMVKRHCRDNFS